VSNLTDAQACADQQRTNQLRDAWELYSDHEDPDCEQSFTTALLQGLVCGQDCEHGRATYPPAGHSYPAP